MADTLYCGPGHEAAGWQAGDFLLTHGDAWASKAIQFGQGLRFRGDRRAFARFNHAALIVDNYGTIIEAGGHGLQVSHVDAYRPTEYVVVRSGMDGVDRSQVTVAAVHAYRRRTPYGYLTIACLAVKLLTGAKVSFELDGTMICSEFVAWALSHGGAIFDKSSNTTMPADLAERYGVR